MKRLLAVTAVVLLVGLGTIALAHRQGKDGGTGEFPIYVAPSTIAVHAPCECVTIHTDVPLVSVVGVIATVNGEVVASTTSADNRGNLVVKLGFGDVLAALGENATSVPFELAVTVTSGEVVTELTASAEVPVKR